MPPEKDDRISDPRALRALSHPTRWSLIELLGLEHSATATRCAEYTGESVASCSYHLGMLAKYGFVEPADGGQGREKPWRLVQRSQSWRTWGQDTETVLAAETLTDVVLEQEFARIREWIRRSSQEPEEWQAAAENSMRTLRVTPEELTELTARIQDLVEPYRQRHEDRETGPDGARTVRMLLATRLPAVRETTPAPDEDEKGRP